MTVTERKSIVVGANGTQQPIQGTDVVSDLLLHYGSFYMDDGTQTITISAAETYYEIGAGLSGGACSSAFTFQNNKELKCNLAGVYFVNWGMSAKCTSAGQQIGGAVMIGSTHLSYTEGMTEGVTANKAANLSGSGIVTLVVNDLVKLCVENETATNDITVTHANLTILKINNV